jgi:hypothetical protein
MHALDACSSFFESCLILVAEFAAQLVDTLVGGPV